MRALARIVRVWPLGWPPCARCRRLPPLAPCRRLRLRLPLIIFVISSAVCSTARKGTQKAARGTTVRVKERTAPPPRTSGTQRATGTQRAGAKKQASSSSAASNKDQAYFNVTGYPFPLGPIFQRPTIRKELVRGVMWGFEQPQSLGGSNVTANVRMTIVRLQSGGLWVHAPVAPTRELRYGCLAAVGPCCCMRSICCRRLLPACCCCPTAC